MDSWLTLKSSGTLNSRRTEWENNVQIEAKSSPGCQKVEVQILNWDPNILRSQNNNICDLSEEVAELLAESGQALVGEARLAIDHHHADRLPPPVIMMSSR